MKFFSKDGVTLSRGVPTPFVIHWRNTTSTTPGPERRRIIGGLSASIGDDVGPVRTTLLDGSSCTTVSDLTFFWSGYAIPYRGTDNQKWVERTYSYSVGHIMCRELIVWPGFDFTLIPPGYTITGNKLLFIVAAIRHYGSISGSCYEVQKDSPGEPGGLAYSGIPAVPAFRDSNLVPVPDWTYLGYAISFVRSTSGALRYSVEPKISYDVGLSQDWAGYYSIINCNGVQLNVSELNAIDATILSQYRSFLSQELPMIEFLQPGVPPSPHLMALPSDIGETGNQ